LLRRWINNELFMIGRGYSLPLFFRIIIMSNIKSPRGSELYCANWQIEAAYRMIQNNLDPEVAEHPEKLIVYGDHSKFKSCWKLGQLG
jgi:urocanate hydratase